MSSAEKDREVWFDKDNGEGWYYSLPCKFGGEVIFGPFKTKEAATEAMQLHGLEE